MRASRMSKLRTLVTTPFVYFRLRPNESRKASSGAACIAHVRPFPQRGFVAPASRRGFCATVRLQKTTGGTPALQNHALQSEARRIHFFGIWAYTNANLRS